MRMKQAGCRLRSCWCGRGRSTTSRRMCQLSSTSTGAGTGGRSTTTPAARGAAAVRLRLRHAAVVVAARAAMCSALARSRSSSAPTCSSGSGTTGSTCSSCWSPSASSARSSCAGSATGRSVHIFNPSAFTLGLFSLVLIATGTTHLTWGQEIATTLSLAPHIYLVLFLVGLVVMYFFSITPVAACGGGDAVRGERALFGADRRSVLPRFRDPVGGVPRAAPAGHRSVDVAAHAAGPGRSSACSTGSACSASTRCSAPSACRPSTTSCCACRCST